MTRKKIYIKNTGQKIIIKAVSDTSSASQKPDLVINSELTAITVSQSSDVRLKTNISDLNNYEERFDRLRPVNFNWKEEFSGNNDNQVGLIAQEVEELFPEAVKDIDHKTINYNYFIAMLIKEVQNLKEKVKKLE